MEALELVLDLAEFIYEVRKEKKKKKQKKLHGLILGSKTEEERQNGRRK